MTASVIRKVLSGLSYRHDKRNCPNNRRRGQFCKGWNRRKAITKKTLNSRLTWNNLGYRMGQYFGSQSKEQIDYAYKVLVDEYQKKYDREYYLFPNEVDEGKSLQEGAKQRVTVNRYERDPQLRKQCIAHYGTKCCICGFSFGDTYGEVAEGFIHVHHVKPLSEIGAKHDVNPVKDLRPVCPNCHAAIHRKGEPAFSVEEVKALLRRSGHTSLNRSPRRRAQS